jgi:photosystem II stability/assembly factor-like uncharacterized protein
MFAKIVFFLTASTLSPTLMSQVMPTPAAERMKSIEQRRSLQRLSLVNNIPFRSIGPSVMSGRVVDLEVNPDDPTEFYVAYATGGLWHSTNNGQSFTSIFDSEDVLFIGDIAVSWGPNRSIWIGTGEVNSSRSSYAGIGIYKSNNNGKTWEYLGLPETHHIGKIQLHPSDRNVAWVAAMGHLYSANKDRGVFKTTDGGKTWKHTLFIDNNTGVVEMDINPLNPKELYAAAWYRTRSASNFEEGGKTSGIYKSVDGGENWTLMSTSASGFPTGDGIGRIGLAVFPKDPNVVYAVLDNQKQKAGGTAKKQTDTSKYELKDFQNLSREDFLALNANKLDTFLAKSFIPKKYTSSSIKELVAANKLKPTVLWDYLFDANAALVETPVIGAEVYRSNDAGKTWRKTNEKDLTFYHTYGYYFGKIYVSPADVNKVLILGFDIQLSKDGGKTFKAIDKPNVHVDHHAAWINPRRDSHIFSGNDGGVNITYDEGASWFLANSPPVGQFYAIAVDNAKPYNVYGGLQDNGSWYGPSTYKANERWQATGNYPYKQIAGSDGMQVQLHKDNQTVYTGSQFGYYYRLNTTTRERKFIKPTHDLGEEPLRFNWQTPIWLSKHNQDILYMGSNRFHRSMNRGDSLPPLSSDLTTRPKQGDVPFGTITTITESPGRFGLLYAGTDDGLVHRSLDGGYTWTNITSTLPAGLWVSRVIASAHNTERVYVALNGYRNDNFVPYLFVSDDNGNTWRSISGNLPNEPINVIREDNKHDAILYVGTDGGLYVTINSGSSYSPGTTDCLKAYPYMIW